MFRCQFCSEAPDPITQLALERGVREFAHGTYVDIPPGRWLVWQGHGLLGPIRYACETHRGDLTAYVRETYGTVAPHAWKRPPFPTSVGSADSDRAFRAKFQAGPGFR